MPITILLVEDHPIFRQGLKSLVERNGMNVVGEASDGLEAVKLAKKFHPDVVILDHSMPRLNGIDAAREIHRESPRSKVIMLTAHREELYVTAAINAGIVGYVVKSEAGPAMSDAIEEVVRGKTYLSPSVARFAVDSFVGKCGNSPPQVLSAREEHLLQLIAAGCTNREIAGQLKLTLKMTEFTRSSLMGKLHIHEVAGLVRYAVRCGLVSPNTGLPLSEGDNESFGGIAQLGEII